jgi:hypothetical protein
MSNNKNNDLSNNNNNNDLSYNKPVDVSYDNKKLILEVGNKWHLDKCKSDTSLNYLNNNLSDNKKINNSLNINNNTFNMTIKKLIDNIEKNRSNNVNMMKYNKSRIINKLDKKAFDYSNNQLVCYNKQTYNLKEDLRHINKQYDYFVKKDNYYLNHSSIYDNKSDFVKKINYKYKLPPTNPIISIKKTFIKINTEINNLNDIIQLIEKYPLTFNVEYNINMKAIHNIKTPLYQLNDMVGMHLLKRSIVDQILYFIQDLHINDTTENNDFMHTCIYGSPGTGKTEVAKIIGKIFSKMGILKKNTFKKATRSDFIAGYLGQTALKTKALIEGCIGGVLFIDEAYALGNPEKRDIFAKECIDTLCESLSDHKNDLMVIIAGYKDELKNCFFNYNKGLDSRFTWRFKTDEYTSAELKLIFIKKINEINWSIKKEVKTKWFEEKKNYFKYFGRDMETLLAKVKIAHGRRVFCLAEKEKKLISLKDMNKGFNLFLENDEVKSRTDKNIIGHMYV